MFLKLLQIVKLQPEVAQNYGNISAVWASLVAKYIHADIKCGKQVT